MSGRLRLRSLHSDHHHPSSSSYATVTGGPRNIALSAPHLPVIDSVPLHRVATSLFAKFPVDMTPSGSRRPCRTLNKLRNIPLSHPTTVATSRQHTYADTGGPQLTPVQPAELNKKTTRRVRCARGASTVRHCSLTSFTLLAESLSALPMACQFPDHLYLLHWPCFLMATIAWWTSPESIHL